MEEILLQLIGSLPQYLQGLRLAHITLKFERPKSTNWSPWKSKTIKMIVPNFEWLKFPTKKLVFGETLSLQWSLDFQGDQLLFV